MTRWFIALVLYGVLLPPAWAWGELGHRVIADIAERHLTPDVRKKAHALLPLLDPQAKTLADISALPDTWRIQNPKTARWHYVAIPGKSAVFNASRDCADQGEGYCLIQALTVQEYILKNSRDRMQRAKALAYVVHLMGDLHQPLHTDSHGDYGGNAVRVRLPGSGVQSLHEVWDKGLIVLFYQEQGWPLQDAGVFARSLDAQRAVNASESLLRGNPVAWAMEAHQKAEKTAYGLLPSPGSDGVHVLDERYCRASQAVIRVQLEAAGLRLADHLNDLLREPVRSHSTIAP